MRKYGTCFFEQYAQIALSSILGSEFDSLVNMDRPDLQTPGSHALGIEVTRAMEESKKAGQELLKSVAGLTEAPEDDDLEQILGNGYAYGLQEGKYVGVKELSYWSMALPLRRILKSKVAKVGNGFYGHFDKMDLYVFCKDPLSDEDAVKAMDYTISLQKGQENRYDRLYLAETGNLYVCNLADGLKKSYRMARYPISQEQRKEFYLESIRRQIEAV